MTGMALASKCDHKNAGHRLVAIEHMVGDGLAKHRTTPAVATPCGPSNHDVRQLCCQRWDAKTMQSQAGSLLGRKWAQFWRSCKCLKWFQGCFTRSQGWCVCVCSTKWLCVCLYFELYTAPCILPHFTFFLCLNPIFKNGSLSVTLSDSSFPPWQKKDRIWQPWSMNNTVRVS